MKLISLTITLVLAISVTQGAPERKVVVPVKRNPNYVPNIHNEIAKAHRKRAPNMGEIPLMNIQNDALYLGTIHVGTPSKPYLVDFDTGSANFWLGANSCSDCDDQRHNYDPHNSSTSIISNKPWNIEYLDKTKASGVIVSDTVDIGGILIKNLPIYAATQMVGMGSDMDGLLGLGFGSLATVPGIKTPFEVMVESNLISSPIFSVHFGKSINKPSGDAGEYIFGGYNTVHIGGKLTTVPVDNSTGHWDISVDNIKVGSTSLMTGSAMATVDTGSALMLFPKEGALEIAKQYNAIAGDNGTFIIQNCNENAIPPLVFDIGGAEFTVPSDALIYERNAENCTAGFGVTSDDSFILGDAFMKNFYFIFNLAVPQIQIAPVK